MTEMALARVFVRLPYRDHAACVGEDPGLFFPERGENHLVQLAKSICARCPVRTECLEDNIEERFGIYGGTTGRERRSYRAQRARAAGFVRREEAVCGTLGGYSRHRVHHERICDACREAHNVYQRAYRAERAS